jgi:hypothetical protein
MTTPKPATVVKSIYVTRVPGSLGGLQFLPSSELGWAGTCDPDVLDYILLPVCRPELSDLGYHLHIRKKTFVQQDVHLANFSG